MDMTEIWRESETGEMTSRLHRPPPSPEWGAWHFDVTGESGDFAGGILPRSVAQRSYSGNDPISAPLSEGAVHIVELTTYERNAKARRLCS